MRKVTYEFPAETGVSVSEPVKPAKKKAKAAKPKAKKPAKKKIVKSKAKKPAAKKKAKPKAKKTAVAPAARLDLRLTKAQKAKLIAKAKKVRRTVTSIVLEALEKIK